MVMNNPRNSPMARRAETFARGNQPRGNVPNRGNMAQENENNVQAFNNRSQNLMNQNQNQYMQQMAQNRLQEIRNRSRVNGNNKPGASPPTQVGYNGPVLPRDPSPYLGPERGFNLPPSGSTGQTPPTQTPNALADLLEMFRQRNGGRRFF